MKCYDFDWQINEFMIYCRSTQLRDRTMYSYEQTLRLFERWCSDEHKIYSVDTAVVVGQNKYRQRSVSSWRDCVAVSAGGYHTVGLKADGTVVAVGDNTFGERKVNSWKDMKLPN